MCGIAGVLDPAAAHDAVRAIVQPMCDALRHRGPDSSGLWSAADGCVSLGHRRLAILDLSPAGHQPMVSRDNRYVLVFNGEIYNHRELRAKLGSEGVTFRGHSDTEVLCEAISRWSVVRTLDRLNGMFAFAVWDQVDRVLILARDRIGEKPLYYGWFGASFVFASELKALRTHRSFTGRLDHSAIGAYLRRSFIPAPLTIYEGISKLPPGCILRIDRDRSAARPEPEPYWSLAGVARQGEKDRIAVGDLPAAADEFDALLHSAVSLRRDADVPLGAFLSGGVDSSLVVALLQAESSQRVKTFTVSIPDDQLNEADAARAVARHLGTDHQQIDLTHGDALALVPELIGMYDEPFGDPSAVPTALMSRAARRYVKVCLSGDGGDELLAGYNRYIYGPKMWARFRHLPPVCRAWVARALQARSPAQWDWLAGTAGTVLPALRQYSPGTKVHKLAHVIQARDGQQVYEALTTFWDSSELLLHPVPLPSRVDPPVHLSLVDQMLYLDGIATLPDDMLVKVDRASMAVSLECRVPLLDHRLIEFSWRLPEEAKVRGGRGKWLLRQVLERYVPRELVERPKLGFDPPIAAWLRGPLRSWASDLLASDRLQRQGLLNPNPIERVWREHQSGQRNHDYALWTILMLQSWLDAESSQTVGAVH